MNISDLEFTTLDRPDSDRSDLVRKVPIELLIIHKLHRQFGILDRPSIELPAASQHRHNLSHLSMLIL